MNAVIVFIYIYIYKKCTLFVPNDVNFKNIVYLCRDDMWDVVSIYWMINVSIVHCQICMRVYTLLRECCMIVQFHNLYKGYFKLYWYSVGEKFKASICITYSSLLLRFKGPILIEKLLKPHNVIKSMFYKSNPKLQNNCLVYSFPCINCDSIYSGETGRSRHMCLKEHKYASKSGSLQSKLVIAQ